MNARFFWAVVLGASLSSGVFAARTSKIKDPFKSLKFDLGGMGDDYEGNDDCAISVKNLDAKTLKVTYLQKGVEKASFYAHDGKLEGVHRSEGDDYENTYTDKNHNGVSVTVADDAYNIITVIQDGQDFACEQDM